MGKQMKKILLVALFPIVAFATDAPQTSPDVSGVLSCINDHVLTCVKEKCIPAALAAATGGAKDGTKTDAKDDETKACVDKCKEGVEDICKKSEQNKAE